MSTGRPVRETGAPTEAQRPVDDETIVRARPADDVGDVGDETIVRAKPLDDETIVRPREANDEAIDETIVRPRPGASDDTAPRGRKESRRQRRMRLEQETAAASGSSASASASGLSASASASVAMPVDDPEAGRSWTARRQQGMDPDRRIAPVPGTAPWDVEPRPERGVRQGAPVVYGTRSEHVGESLLGADAVHREIGAAPPARSVQVRPDRGALPSLDRRARRGRITTLVVGCAVLVVSATGLWVIAAFAFG